MKKQKKLLYFFNHPAAEDLKRIHQKIIPSERLYGMVELIERGWEVEACDVRFVGRFSKLSAKLRRYGVNLLGLRALASVSRYDMLLVKDNFSELLTIFARLLRKPILYLDSLFFIPSHPVRRAHIRFNLWIASRVACYSRYQAELWSAAFGVNRAKFFVVRYAIDVPFYRRGIEAARQRSVKREVPYVLSVGRDLGRDFETLVVACREAEIAVKIVTLPYLVPKSAQASSDVEILQDISYEELFDLYAGATMAIVPLKAGVEYPSGIRAVMESMAVGCPTIATRTQILEEYVSAESDALLYTDAGDAHSMCACIRRLAGDQALRNRLAGNASQFAATDFQMSRFVEQLESLMTA